VKKLFLYGEEDYLLTKELEQLQTALKQKNPDISVEEHSANCAQDKLFNSLFTQNMFAPIKLIIYRGLFDFKEEKTDFLQKNIISDETENTLCVAYKGNPDKRKKAYKFLQANFEIKEFKKYEIWDKGKLVENIISLCKAEGFAINRNSAERLIDISGYNMWFISNSLQKIMTSLLPKKSISLEDVEELASSGEQNSFEFVDFFRTKQKKELFIFLDNIRKGEEAMGLHAMLSKHIRFLLQLKDINARTVEEYAKETGKSPYYLKKIVPDLGKWESSALIRILTELHEWDYLTKKGSIAPLAGMYCVLGNL